MPRNIAECIDEAMTFVANQPGGAARLLAIHARLNDGHCRGCVSSNTLWPCSTASIALAVLDRDCDAEAQKRGTSASS